MSVIEITSLEHPGVEVFSTLTEAQLRNRIDPQRGIFIAESPKVIRVALEAGYEPVSLLCERKHLTGDAADIVQRMAHLPIYTGDRELLARLTGYTLTRGVLCAMRRPAPRPGGSMPWGTQGSGHSWGGGYHQYRGHLPFGSRTGYRCRTVDHGFVRPAEPSGGAGVDGIGVSGALDVGRPSAGAVEGTGVPHGSHGADRPFRAAELSAAEGGTATGPGDGYRRRRTAGNCHRGSGLCGAYSHGTRGRFAQCGSSFGRGFLGVTMW